jgi:hypothetical protein
VELHGITVVHLERGLWDVRALQALGAFHVVTVDLTYIVGNDLTADGLAIGSLLLSVFAPTLRVLIIKSRHLSLHAHSFQSAHSFQNALSSPTAGLVDELRLLDEQFTAAHAAAVASSGFPAAAAAAAAASAVAPVVVGGASAGAGSAAASSSPKPRSAPSPAPPSVLPLARPVRSAHAKVLCTIGVAQYRECIPLTVLPHSRVLELGCADGKTCRLVFSRLCELGDASPDSSSSADDSDVAAAAAVVSGSGGKGGKGSKGGRGGGGGDSRSCVHTRVIGSVVGVDVSKVCVEEARRRSPAAVRFEVADAWDVVGLLSIEPAADVVFVDVGGISSADGAFEGLALVRQLCNVYARTLRYVVVKSRCLLDHANRWTSFEITESTPAGAPTPASR